MMACKWTLLTDSKILMTFILASLPWVSAVALLQMRNGPI
jgi:hypothetical protein